MKKPRARLVIPCTLTVAVVTVAAIAAVGACNKGETMPEEGGCVALDTPADGGPEPDCSAGPDGGECPPGCAYI